MEISKGIGLGIGFILGIILVVLILGFLILTILGIYKLWMRKRFSIELFKKYRKRLLKEENFEELHVVSQIIDKLEKKEKPTELLQNYQVMVDSYLYWQPTYWGGERLVFKNDKQIIKIKKQTNRKKN